MKNLNSNRNNQTGSIGARVNKDRDCILGRGVRSTSESQSPVDRSGSSGTSPRMANTMTTSRIEDRNDTAANHLPQQTAVMTKAGKMRQRIKWTEELNCAIMRLYYKITELESNNRPFRNELYREFKEKYPTMNVTEQQIAGQRLAIVKNKYLTNIQLQRIKEQVALEIREQNENDISAERIKDDYDVLNGNEENISKTEERSEKEDEVKKIKERLELAIAEYERSDPTNRKPLGRVSTSVKLGKIIDIINTKLLPDKIAKINSLEDLHCLIYCAALASTSTYGYVTTKIRTSTRVKTKTPNEKKPEWQIRLEKRITEVRSNLGKLIAYRDGKLKNKSKAIRKLIKQCKDNVAEGIDDLKQKVAVLAGRLKRYKKCDLRKNKTQCSQKLKNSFIGR